jgi:FtsZ-binding cell division protein ZapB
MDHQTILSLASLSISAILAYVYVQIRLNLAETIVRILNGRYLRTDVSELKFRRVEELLVDLRAHIDSELEKINNRLDDERQDWRNHMQAHERENRPDKRPR